MNARGMTTIVFPRPGQVRLALLAGLVVAALIGGGIFWYTRPDPDSDGPDPITDPSAKLPLAASGPPWFRDMTETSGLSFTFRNGEEADQFTILESLGGGVALFDYDGDGLLDIFVTGGGTFDGPARDQIMGRPCKLYKNLGGLKFRDVTKAAGLDIPWWYTQGAAVADYDRDGWPDLLVTGYGRLALFRNEPEPDGRRFIDVTEKLGLRDNSWSTSAGWADLHGDGFPDLYVCHYVNWSFANNPPCKGYGPGVKRDVCSPTAFKPLVHALFRNQKGKMFRNASADHGFKPEGSGLGVVLADLNDDGRPDIYVANDTNNNFLFLNRGGKLEEKALLAGVATDENGRATGSMGTDVGDYDGSGRPSLVVANFQGELHHLFRNLGGENFLYQSRAAGLGAIGQHFVGFGAVFLDADNDGWEDLVIANGHVFRNVQGKGPQQRPVLLRNVERQGRRFFEDASGQGGPFFQTPVVGRGVALGDLDNDGWPDLVVSCSNSPVVILRNSAASTMKTRHRWLGVKLVGRDRRDVVGSTVILEAGSRKLTRFAKGGGSYLSAGDPRILFGLGSSDQVKRVQVRWSWGQTQTWDNLRPGHYWELREDQPGAKRLEYPAP